MTGRNNFAALVKEELVRRFESVVQEEIRSHNIAIQKTNRDIRLLNEILEECKKQNQSIKTTNLLAYQDVQDRFVKECSRLENAFEEQRRFIRKNADRLDSLIESFEQKIDQFVDFKSFKEFADECKNNYDTARKFVLDISAKINENIFELHNQVLEKIDIYKKNHEQHLDSLKNQIDKLNQNLDLNKIDSIGILKELQVYKKTVFVIEKKIEHIYTQIERIKERL